MTEGGVSWADVLALVAQLDDSGLADAEVVAAGVHVRVSRTALDSPAPVAVTTAVAPAEVAGDRPAIPEPVQMEHDGPVIVAPMLGVLYHRPGPDQPPFVQVGDEVTPETTVAIIEVMKLMNPVAAGVSGSVVEVCVADGKMVEHGDVLFRLRAPG